MLIEAPQVYAIADATALGSRPLSEAVREIAEAGVRWIQLRAKTLRDDLLFEEIERCHRALAGSGCRLWMNDRVDLAALFPFRGVHLGQADLEPAAARRVVGPGRWIGQSTHSLEQLRRADGDPAVDVVAYGPVFATGSKRDPGPPVGIPGLRAARAATRKPLVAIGGIGAANLARVLETGADAAAMIGAICQGDIGVNCRRLLHTVALARGQTV
jgi:thiamine-phosphate pyrophosphorylase